MMVQKKTADQPRSLLGLLPLPQGNDEDPSSAFGLALHANHAFSDEPGMSEELMRQNLAMVAEKLKTIAATHHVTAIHQQAAGNFLKLTQHYADLSAASEGQSYHRYYLEWLHNDLQNLALEGFDVMRIGVGNIKNVVREPLYKPEKREKPRWKRLLGG